MTNVYKIMAKLLLYDPLPNPFYIIDDAVSIKICSDVNIADCSETENWKAREFKECKNKNFKVILNKSLFSISRPRTRWF